MGIWTRKSVAALNADATDHGAPRLKRSLGVVGLTAFGVGGTIGAGIFSLTGNVAAHQAGPAVTLSFVLASIACFFAGLCYAEFAAMVPIAGSAAGFTPLDLLGELISIGTLLAFAVVCAGILVLRKAAPDARRPFRTPWVPVIPIAGVLSCLYLMISLPKDTWIRLVIWMAVGLAVYSLYGYRHSKMRHPPATPALAASQGPRQAE
jgi:amino acid transporter